MFRSILVAVDSSEGANRAVDVAADLARTCGAKVILVHAVAGPGAMVFEDPSIAAHGEDLVEESEKLIQRLSDRIADVKPEAKLIDMPAASSIVRTAQEVGADLIVLGVRKRGFLEQLLGRVTNGVLHHAPCSVLIAR